MKNSRPIIMTDINCFGSFNQKYSYLKINHIIIYMNIIYLIISKYFIYDYNISYYNILFIYDNFIILL